MLVLTRKIGQSIKISEDITVTVLASKTGGVRLGIEAPKTVKVLRDELVPYKDDEAA